MAARLMSAAVQPKVERVAAPGRDALTERTIAFVRIGAASGAALLLAFGGEHARSYPAVASAAVVGAVLYTAAMTTSRFRLPPQVSTGLDLSFSVAIIATTGAGRSVAIGLLFLVVAAAALRFSPAVSRAVAIAGGCATAIVIVAMPRPELAMSLRIEVAIGWGASLILMAVLVARLADFESREREELLVERERAAALAQQAASRRRTLRMVAHDLTAPLAAVEGISLTLRDRGEQLDETTRDEALGLLVEHAHHLRGFASSLHDVANAGGVSRLRRTNAVPLDLGPFLAGVCRTHTLEPSRRVTVDERSPLPMITTDPAKLRRILVNLIDNALRHSPARTPVVIAADIVRGQDGERVALTIIDEGTGVAEADLGRIFLPEWQGDGEVGESGLGLWIVAELVDDLGGAVRASNTATGGLAVTVELPTG